MVTQARRSTFPSSPRVWLVAFALAIGGLVLAPYYLMTAILPWLPISFDKVPVWYSTLFFYHLVSNLLFTHLIGYLAFSLLGISLVIAALLWARPHWLVSLLLVLTLLALVAFPWVSPYRPALVAAPGLAMREPTDPGWLGGVVKRAQVAAEIHPCNYILLGWSKDSTFYYQALCGDEPMQTWAVNPDREASGRMIPSAPLELFVEGAPVTVGARVRAEGVRPIAAEPSTRQLNLRGSLLSPNGNWVALLARHVYGPEDVVIVQWARNE
jgi:hypothetical protein